MLLVFLTHKSCCLARLNKYENTWFHLACLWSAYDLDPEMSGLRKQSSAVHAEMIFLKLYFIEV